MNESLIRKTNLFGAWCGVVYCVMLLVGWWVVGGFYPLHQPSAGAAEIGAFFRGDTVGIRIGMVMIMWGAAVFIPFTAAMADCVSRVEGRSGPLTKMTMLAGFGNSILTFYPPMYWIAAAFRSGERSDELLYLLNDIAWLQFIGGLSLIMPMLVTVAVAALHDKSAQPVFPRWAAFVSILAFVLFLPDQLLFFFKTGPFAWNGLFAFWIPLSAFCGWFLVIFYLIRRAMLRESSTGHGRQSRS